MTAIAQKKVQLDEGATLSRVLDFHPAADAFPLMAGSDFYELCQDLFKQLWDTYSNTDAPLINSAGAPMSRGVSAQADFDANTAIQLLKATGRALVVAGQGAGLTNRVHGTTFGAGTTNRVN